MVVSFIIFLCVFVAIGVSSVLMSKSDKHDYYLAGQTIKPWLVGLSAVATNNSGYMFIGVIGYTYHTGLAAIWLMVGWILGDFIASSYVHARLRHATGSSGEVSFAGVIAGWSGENRIMLQRILTTLSIIFLLAYASAQLVAGGKALQVLLGWPAWGGAVMGSILVAVYCFSGGIRASIWTDAAQSFVMIVAMCLLFVVTVNHFGGWDASVQKLNAVEGFMDWTPPDLLLPGVAGVILFAVGWMFAGFSVIGQPHIMVRFMTLEHGSLMTRARVWYYSWFTLFYFLATGVGLLSRIFLPDIGNFDAELALPTMAKELLPDVLVGLILAGLFAATLSTADSLVLSCSASLTHDLLPHNIEKPLLLKLATIGMTFLALMWALSNKQSVFSLVVMAWSSLACAFGPLLFGQTLGWRVSQVQALIVAAVGLFTALAWRWFDLHNDIYEGMPGILLGLAVFFWLSRRYGTQHARTEPEPPKPTQ